MNSAARIPASLTIGAVFAAGSVLYAQPCQDQWALIPPPQGEVASLTLIDLGSKPELYAYTQYFPLGSGVIAPTILRWNGSGWDAFAPVTFGGNASAFEVFDDGTGPAMFVGGEFGSVNGVVSPSLIRWDGVSWRPVPTGWGAAYTLVNNMCAYDDGSGMALVVGGWFPGGVAGIPTSHIARWDGTNWHGFGTGLTGGNGGVGDIEVYDDDGPGPNPPALYVGGWFTWAGGMFAPGLARWDGRQWHALGSGIQGGGPVRALCVYDDGADPALYVGGAFVSAGGVPGTRGLARWDGASWSSVAHPILIQFGFLPGVSSLYVFDDGVRGPGLIAGGEFTTIGGVNVPRLARYDGSAWSGLGDGPLSWFTHMTRFDEGPTPTLWVNAAFEIAPGQYTGIGRYQYVCEPCYPDCDGSGTLTIKDFTCFQSKFVAADPQADCNASGTLTVADFSCFQTKFVAGCP